MDTPSNITDALDQADEEIFTPTLSDEALEAAAVGGRPYPTLTFLLPPPPFACC
jgi:hypothetical protein